MRGVRARLFGPIATVGLLAGSANAAPRRVPSEYATIQTAIDAAAAGDTVLVEPGEYAEYVTRSLPGYGSVTAMAFLRDGVVLRGEGGAGTTVLRHGPTPAATVIAYAPTSTSTAIEGFTVLGNSPDFGGFSLLDGRKLTIRECVFKYLGVGAYAYLSHEMEVIDSRFEDCRFLGGVYHEEGLCLLTRCTFLRCRDSAVNLNGWPGFPTDRAEIRDCLFQDCVRESPGGGGGGAIHMSGYSQGTVIDRCTFVRNTTNNAGGAVQMANGVVSNSIFWGNQAVTHGGGLTIANSASQVIGNTFFESTLLGPIGGGGAAVSFFGGTTEFTNNIIASAHGAPAVRVAGSGVVTTGCNVFWDNADGIGFNYTLGPTDRIADPMFCDPVVGDLELFGHSPCVPENSLGCGLIGALEDGCGVVSLEPESWGRIKAGYRAAKGVTR